MADSIRGFQLGGLQQGMGIARKSDLDERTMRINEGTAFQKQIADNINVLSSVAKAVAERGEDPSTNPQVLKLLEATKQSVGTFVPIAQKMGIPGADPIMINRQLESAIYQVTPQQKAEGEARGRVAGARMVAEETGRPEKEAFEAAGILPKKDPTGIIINAAKFVTEQLDKAADPMAIREALTAIEEDSSSPEVTRAIQAIKLTMPLSTEEHEIRKTKRDIAAAQPLINELVAAGVPRDMATILILGGKSASVSVSADKQKYGEKELADIRGNIRASRTAVTALERMLPLINEDTVGIWGAFTENVGGVAQQLPVIKQIANIFNVTSKNTVTQVKEARSAFRTNIASLREFILKEKGRLSDQDLNFAIQSTGILDKTTDADSAKNIVTNLIRIAKDIESGLTQELRQGGITVPQKTTVRRRPDGGFDVVDEGGNIIDTIKPITIPKS